METCASSLCSRMPLALESARQLHAQTAIRTTTLSRYDLSLAMPLLSQDNVDGFLGRVYKKGRQTMPYRLFVPRCTTRTSPILSLSGCMAAAARATTTSDRSHSTTNWAPTSGRGKKTRTGIRHSCWPRNRPAAGTATSDTGLSRELKLVLEILVGSEGIQHRRQPDLRCRTVQRRNRGVGPYHQETRSLRRGYSPLWRRTHRHRLTSGKDCSLGIPRRKGRCHLL